MKFNRDHPYFWPVMVAVALHIILIIILYFIPLPYVEMIKKAVATFNLDSTITEEPLPKGPAEMGLSASASAIADSLMASKPQEAQLGDMPLASLLDEQTVSPQIEEETLSRKSEIAAMAEAPVDRQSQLFEIQKKEGAESVEVKTTATDALKAFQMAPEQKARVGEDNLLETLEEVSKSSDQSLQRTVDPEEGMPGFTPNANERFGAGSGAQRLDQGLGESKAGVSRFESIDEFMDIKVFTYEHPGDPKKYFMIKIFAKEGKTPLKVLPKEIIFTIDASLSISADRLEEFKRGIRYCLENLNAKDTFNIVAFKDQVLFFSPVSTPVNAGIIKRAEKFVGELEASERTDVYAAFEKIVKLPLERKPSSIVLMSDGRPTYGVVNSRELISSVTRLNQTTRQNEAGSSPPAAARPIFAYTGGAKVNRYLLDFVAYQNRAWSQFVKQTSDIDKGLAEFYRKIKDPLFLNLRYRLSAVPESEVYPKSLPDFYQGTEFTLYGTFSDEDDFSMQLLGDVEDKTKELLFSRSLKKAERGTQEIRRDWAFNKIYYLISRITLEGPKQELLNEIRSLSEIYAIQTPYSPELETLD